MGWAQRTRSEERQTETHRSPRKRRPLIDSPGAICVVSGDRTTYPQFGSNVATLQSTRGSVLLWHLAGGGEIAHARNHLARQALDRGARWIFYLDDDHVLAPDVLGQLLRHDVDIVVPMVLMRKPPQKWIAWEHFDIPDTATDDEMVQLCAEHTNPPALRYGQSGLVEIGMGGTGGMLIRAEVFERLPEPWFQFGKLGPTLPGEDTYFCLTARRAGFKMFCDLDTSIGHLTTVAVWPSHNQYTGQISASLDFAFDGTAMREAGRYAHR